jgi:hypothetical protein
MKLFERFTRRTQNSAAPDPGSPHRFRAMNDAGMGAAPAGGSGTSTGAALGMDATVTGNFMREQRCGVPGCNRRPDDSIHFP